ncbi:hypothetical protein WSK_3629 [Novosphingobium sp. Rr 2-17]|uniref:ArdC family protein n=1 Tax=Novosphingobium sp. Rr 2-17 TaxID=555793 RepID=UPI000269ABB4|nr:hypothetical protein WSK_3629 [Novosphingobium sp. Rr 2-17]
MTCERQSLYAEVTARIIAELEEGRIPWVQPWDASKCPCTMPHNAVSGRLYSGINVLILWATGVEAGFSSQRWLTFRQCAAAGGHVRRGEKGTVVCYADRFTPKDEMARAQSEDREARQVAFLKRFVVFNLDQCEGLPEELTAAPAVPDPVLAIAEADKLIAATGADFRVGGSEAFYSPAGDYVQVPPQAAFHEPVNWYRTALHELGHLVGGKGRLERDQTGAFGSAAYSREELVVRRVGANIGVKTCLLDSWENPCVPDLPVPMMIRLKSRKGNGTIACRENAQTAETIVGRAGHRKMRMAKATLPELQSSGFYPRQRRSDGCNAAPCGNRFAHENRYMKRVARLDALGPASTACLLSVGSKGRTERLPASHLLVRVNTGLDL